VAITEKWKNTNGEKLSKAEWHYIIMLGKQVEFSIGLAIRWREARMLRFHLPVRP
jgi:hypothetical protein